MSDWLCNKCETGVLNDVEQTSSKRSYMGLREAVRVCPECGAENPVWSFNSDDLDYGMKLPEDNIVLIAGGLPNEWKRLSDVRPMHGQLVEYRGGKSDRKVYSTIDPKSKGNTFDDLDNTIRQGYFLGDCGTHWTESLLSFTEEKWPHIGKQTLPDPDITFWRAVIDWDKETSFGSDHAFPKIMRGGLDTGIVCDEPNYTLIEEGKQVGKFWFDERIKRFKFEGDMEASAQIFMELVLRTLNQEKVK